MKKYRMTVEMSEKQYKLFTSLAKEAGLDSSEAIKQSFQLYEVAVKLISIGGSVILRNKNGEEIVAMEPVK